MSLCKYIQSSHSFDYLGITELLEEFDESSVCVFFLRLFFSSQKRNPRFNKLSVVLLFCFSDSEYFIIMSTPSRLRLMRDFKQFVEFQVISSRFIIFFV